MHSEPKRLLQQLAAREHVELDSENEVATMQRRRVIGLLASAALGGANVLQAKSTREEGRRAHMAWVAEVLKRMETLLPGMTRKDLFSVFTTEGGISTGLRRTFVSRDCPYFKVDVEFQPVGRAERDADERVTLVESDDDIILKISTPYLQFSVVD